MRLVGLVAGEVGECISALGVRFAEVTTAMGVSTTATSVAGGVVDTGCLMGVVGGLLGWWGRWLGFEDRRTKVEEVAGRWGLCFIIITLICTEKSVIWLLFPSMYSV